MHGQGDGFNNMTWLFNIMQEDPRFIDGSGDHVYHDYIVFDLDMAAEIIVEIHLPAEQDDPLLERGGVFNRFQVMPEFAAMPVDQEDPHLIEGIEEPVNLPAQHDDPLPGGVGEEVDDEEEEVEDEDGKDDEGSDSSVSRVSEEEENEDEDESHWPGIRWRDDWDSDTGSEVEEVPLPAVSRKRKRDEDDDEDETSGRNGLR
ncbi:hypothetical protein F2P81_024085 [Scophthalmus maximus]|uniref:Uncharacterized protein n=1 Tax=Scophthalmus maximus TaxID=52904 RepID=A0A6A4RTD9_SCOMX|nr:hypothetical protein F2P81_024085 [Scophthalmus maximus]